MNSWNILRAAHVELFVTDLGKSKQFYVEMLGFIVTEETNQQVYLRGVEERVHHSVVLTKSAFSAVGHLSFRVMDDTDLEKLYEFYVAKGCEAQWKEQGSELGREGH